MNNEELIRALETARWKTEAMFNLASAGNSPGTTNGPTVMCVGILAEIDKALDIVLNNGCLCRSDAPRVLLERQES